MSKYTTNQRLPAADHAHAQQQRLLSPGSSPAPSPGVVRGPPEGAISTDYRDFTPYSYERSPNSRRNSRLSYASSNGPSEKHGPSARNGYADAAIMPVYLWSTNEPEDDDELHAPSPADSRKRGDGDSSLRFLFSARGLVNLGTLILMLLAILMLFVGYPIVVHLTKGDSSTSGYNLGGINGSGQIPSLPGLKTLIDSDTPQDAMTRTGSDGETYTLVFSDEFETAGRSFYSGDDPYWEAQDFHYWATGDYEWYDPSAVTTEDGKLVITISKTENHDLDYMSAMITTWNKVCFTTGYVEVSVSLPGSNDVSGFWPGVWTMGNLGKAGFGATTDGTWPYTYDACDVGTFPQQMDKDGNPSSSATDGYSGSYLSTQQGQRLSACTCPGSDHPGPSVSSGRGAPELDVLEALVLETDKVSQVSQSYQIAPFNANVEFVNSSDATTIFDSTQTSLNSFTGNQLQESVSAVTFTDSDNYNGTGYAMYGVEWWSDMDNRDDGHVTWYANGVNSWKITSATIGADSTSEVSQRLISEEPMYLIINLGLSDSFSTVDFDNLEFPAKMYVEYVRVYQRDGVDEGVTCDPSHHPTANYITNHPDAYTNSNMTTWNGAGYLVPRNSEYDGC